MCISSSGGHWVQLMKITEGLSNCELIYISTDESLKSQVKQSTFYKVLDANMWSKMKLVKLFFQMFFIILKVRPKVIISTGAAPGFFGVFVGKLLGIKTIWIDSIANSDELSLAGIKVVKLATYTLTQWRHLESNNVIFKGSVL